MYINKAISIHGGWEILQDKHEALAEIKQLLSKIEYSSLHAIEHRINTVSHISSNDVRLITLNRVLRTTIRHSGWRQTLKDRNASLVPDIQYFKFGVSLDFSMNAGTALERNIDRWCLVDVTRAQNNEQCDLNVLIVWDSIPLWLPTPVYIKQARENHTYQTLITYFNNNVLPLYHNKPMVVLTISEEDSSIELIELENNSEVPTIERVLEFTPENYQAGVGILSYFGEILKQKYPDIDAKVRIEQDDCLVRMTIDTPDGNQEIIEEAFDTYTQVVIKEKEPEELLDNKIQISELKMQLSMIETQLEHKKELLILADERYKNDVVATRNEVEFLRQCLSKQMQLTHGSQVLIGKQIEKEEKITLAQLSCFDNTIQTLVEQSSGNQKLVDALSQIQYLLDNGVSDKDEQASKAALEIIQEESPSTYSQLSELLKNSMYGVSGNIIFTWMTELSKVLG
ncbi:hypothetical protein [Photobacterium ganghwense]|uniref:hypothetical protein n=1 Tax=Photobacterium ganghwense TaxID=320778 RepID=UPI001C2CD6C8|nr:hypothetical protein [Photobacterium ganghwense]MBV1843521.1 hypothetical protein [Photobacterium ganghwense]